MAAFEQLGIVRWNETDASGRFHYTVAMIWAENAEHALYRQIAPGFDLASIPRRSVGATFHRPFECGDTYTVKLWVEAVGNSSLRYVWHVLNGDVLAVEGQNATVHVGPDGKPAPLPEALKSALQAYLKPGD